jgi:hypothetical protein
MEYLMFVVVDPTGEQSDESPEAWVNEMDAAGIRLHGDRLQAIEDATTVRVRGGEVIVSDGPFTDSKEWIAGYDLLECDSLEQAVEVASKHPMARAGAVEVRAAWPIDLATFAGGAK